MQPFVPASWVRDRDVAVVDVREPWEYDSIGHLPGAVNVPFDAFRSDEGEAGKLPPRGEWEALLSEAGIGSDAEIVAYDDTQGVFAARFVVTALLLGHDPGRLHVLDGDFSSWQREYGTTTDPVDPTPAEYESDPDAETPLVDFETVRDLLPAVDAGDVTLVDTREEWEFEEGHLPGAVQLDWRELVDEGTRGLRPENELRALLTDRGIVPEKRAVLYCNTARRVSHTYLVLRQLGYGTVDLYEGSLTEWRERGGELVGNE
ncbi:MULTISPECIES: sulfurtransferase [Halolamina]|uniref:Thiosulfate/3-mercaptopyruvate sulfurtransferase n=1 Tax=Halolamina pelagica TaxID=699431 RepID=A0A1I5SKQ5_9EURY|nr:MULTISPECIES: rhodanese-like domain-containing protein [Halolamina]NHX37013.1 sulfurtransferase [Halolamina sp. R1-12]SFP71299.1 thiosulfate/3-mercaptopyruvate sulfurtransferase [Halolamina pelagica]